MVYSSSLSRSEVTRFRASLRPSTRRSSTESSVSFHHSRYAPQRTISLHMFMNLSTNYTQPLSDFRAVWTRLHRTVACLDAACKNLKAVRSSINKGSALDALASLRGRLRTTIHSEFENYSNAQCVTRYTETRGARAMSNRRKVRNFI